MERFEVRIGADTVVGNWHWPEGRKDIARPVIVMGHGFGAEWHFGTCETILDFTRAGFAVATFDYRHFGESGGRPRHLILIHKQLEDWRAVLAFVREDERIAPDRLAIWGASLGGGHALTIAAWDRGVAATVVQAPHCSAFEAAMNFSALDAMISAQHAFYDLFIAPFGGVHKIPMINDPGRLGAITFSGWLAEAARFVPPGGKWRNAMPARSLLSLGRYSPGLTAERIKCPVCIHYGDKDPAVPTRSVERTAKKIEDVEVHAYEGEHFDIYHGDLRAEVAAEQIDFLQRRV